MKKGHLVKWEKRTQNEPKRTQSKPISPPHPAKQTQIKPNQSQFQRQKTADKRCWILENGNLQLITRFCCVWSLRQG